MTLYLIRHAHAGQRVPGDPDDHLRPLSRKGLRQAETLAKACKTLELRFDRLFSSPYTRARETAAALQGCSKGRQLEFLEELTGEAYGDLLRVLGETLKPEDSSLALVGHEPYLSDLASVLLTGDVRGFGLRFRKGMLIELGGALGAGTLELRSALTADQLKRLAA